MSEKKELKKEQLEKVSGGSRVRDVDGKTIPLDGSISTFDTTSEQNKPNNTNDDGMVVQHNM